MIVKSAPSRFFVCFHSLAHFSHGAEGRASVDACCDFRERAGARAVGVDDSGVTGLIAEFELVGGCLATKHVFRGTCHETITRAHDVYARPGTPPHP